MIRTDQFGNKIITENHRKRGREFYLVLKGEQRPRKIGTLKDGIFFVRRNPKRHTHYVTHSIGFNSELINNILDSNQPIILRMAITKQKYLLSPAIILQIRSAYYTFSESGFETQIFVPFENLVKYIINDEKKIIHFITYGPNAHYQRTLIRTRSAVLSLLANGAGAGS